MAPFLKYVRMELCIALRGYMYVCTPQAVLAAIICGSMFGMLKQVTDVKKYFRVSYSDTVQTHVCLIVCHTFIGSHCI